jgi:hypothetical protein
VHREGYFVQAEAAMEDRGALERLAEAAGRDPELSEEDRGSVSARIGQYLDDDSRAEAGGGDEPMTDEEMDAA